MEIDKLVSALEKTLFLLRKSESSFWSSLSVEEVIGILETELDKAKNSQQVDIHQLKYLFLPTAPIQEISIDNGWGNEFVEISEIVDQYT
jgi:hypothetical protein